MALSYLSKNNTIVLLSFIFIINPFLACISSIIILRNGNPNIKIFSFFIALFVGLLAFTQYSPNGDIARSYHIINAIKDFSYDNFLAYLTTDKYIVYTIVNVVITKVTGNVQYTSLLWGGLTYYICFLAIINLGKYFEFGNRKIYMVIVSAMICFVIFVETMETMKQALATSITLYSFSCYLQGKRLKCIIVFILSLGVHFSSLFMLPLFFAKSIKSFYVYIILVISFLLRNINLMELSASILNRLGIFSSVASLADAYTEQNFNNFFSDAPYFLFTFWLLCFIILLNRLFVSKDNDIIDKACVLFIIVLNLNYSNNHNFTRLLLFSFPIYILIFMNVLCNLKQMFTRKILILFILSITFFLHFWFSLGRFGTDVSKYQTSFMDNSITKIITSPLYSYLNYKIEVN